VLKLVLQIVGCNSEEKQKTFGRHFDIDDELVSHISRRSIDVLNTNHQVSYTVECIGNNVYLFMGFCWTVSKKVILLNYLYRTICLWRNGS
jgi:hypothetical protein